MSPRKRLRIRRGGSGVDVEWGRLVLCVALAGGGTRACVVRRPRPGPLRTNFRVERRTARTTQDWCKPLHRLDGPIRRIVGLTLAVNLGGRARGL